MKCSMFLGEIILVISIIMAPYIGICTSDAPYSIDGDAGSSDVAGLATEIAQTGHFIMAPIILFPNYHDKVTNKVEVNWLPAIDSFGHDITYEFWYSPDAGNTWIQEDSGLTSIPYEWYITDLKSGSRYKIRIVATCEAGKVAVDESGKFEIFKIKASH